MCDTLEKQRISLISNIIQGGRAQKEVFDCLGHYEKKDDSLVITFENDAVAGTLRVEEKNAVLTYHKPYPNTLTFRVHQSTHANYSSMYGVMSLIIDTKRIERLPGKVVLKYELLQTNYRVGEYEITLIYEEVNN